MRKLNLILLLASCLATPGGFSQAAANDDATTLERIAAYRLWTRVTPEPIKVEVPVTTVDPARIDLSSIAG
jgi:hypothetical protein